MSPEARPRSITILAASWRSWQRHGVRRFRLAVRLQNSATGPARIYRAGEAFYEPPGSEHLVSENASATEPASLLAVFVADDGATLRVDDP
jgi:hypothetical protein